MALCLGDWQEPHLSVRAAWKLMSNRQQSVTGPRTFTSHGSVTSFINLTVNDIISCRSVLDADLLLTSYWPFHFLFFLTSASSSCSAVGVRGRGGAGLTHHVVVAVAGPGHSHWVWAAVLGGQQSHRQGDGSGPSPRIWICLLMTSDLGLHVDHLSTASIDFRSSGVLRRWWFETGHHLCVFFGCEIRHGSRGLHQTRGGQNCPVQWVKNFFVLIKENGVLRVWASVSVDNCPPSVDICWCWRPVVLVLRCGLAVVNKDVGG